MVCLSLSAGIPGLHRTSRNLQERASPLTKRSAPLFGHFSSLHESRSMFGSSTKHLTFPAQTHLSFDLCPFLLWCSIDRTSSHPCFAGASHRCTAISYLGRRIPLPHHQILSRLAHPIATPHRMNELILFSHHDPSIASLSSWPRDCVPRFLSQQHC